MILTKTEITASRTDSITAKASTYSVTRPAPAVGQQLGLSIDRTGWTDPTASLTLNLEISQDGGQTWRHWCGVTDRGGAGLPTAEWVAPPPPAGAITRITASSNGKAVKQPFALLEIK